MHFHFVRKPAWIDTSTIANCFWWEMSLRLHTEQPELIVLSRGLMPHDGECNLPSGNREARRLSRCRALVFFKSKGAGPAFRRHHSGPIGNPGLWASFIPTS